MASLQTEEAISRFTDLLIAERDVTRARRELELAVRMIPESELRFYVSETNTLREDFEALPIGSI
jgi:hypothetical protein